MKSSGEQKIAVSIVSGGGGGRGGGTMCGVWRAVTVVTILSDGVYNEYGEW